MRLYQKFKKHNVILSVSEESQAWYIPKRDISLTLNMTRTFDTFSSFHLVK